MTQFTSFNTKNLKEAEAELKKALVVFESQTGIVLTLGNIRYNDVMFTTKLEARIASSAAAKEQIVDQAFNAIVARLGLKLTNAKGDTLTGYKPSRPSYPFLFKTKRGTEYKITEAQAKAMFGA